MEPRIIDEMDDQGNPIYVLDASGNQVLDASGNPVVKTTEAFDKIDVDVILKEKAELAARLAKLEEDNRIKDENFRKMRQPQPQQQQPQIDVSKVVEEQLKKRDYEAAQASARHSLATRLGSDQQKVEAAMQIFNKLFETGMNVNDTINSVMAVVSPRQANANWTGGGNSGQQMPGKPVGEDFSKDPNRTYAYKEISSQLDKINNKENKLWNKPKQ